MISHADESLRRTLREQLCDEAIGRAALTNDPDALRAAIAEQAEQFGMTPALLATTTWFDTTPR